jgi:hypothetical protein
MVDPDNPKNKRTIAVVHPAFRKWMEEEERQAQFSRYVDRLVESISEGLVNEDV